MGTSTMTISTLMMTGILKADNSIKKLFSKEIFFKSNPGVSEKSLKKG